ncbi:hypothetical protein D3C71_1486780 [compost metagenome]
MAAQVQRTAQRRQAAFRLLEHVVHARLRIKHGLAGRIHHPARRHGLVVQLIDLDLVGRDGGGRHVQHERRIASRRGRERQWIGAQYWHRGARGHQRHATRGGGDQAHQAARAGHAGIQARGAKMMRIAHAHHPHAMRQGLVDRQRHGHRRHGMAKARAPVQQRGAAAVAHDGGPRLQRQHARAAHFLVHHQHRHAVRVHAQQVGLHHDVRGGPRQIGRHAPGIQDAQDLALHAPGIHFDNAHVSSLCRCAPCRRAVIASSALPRPAARPTARSGPRRSH